MEQSPPQVVCNVSVSPGVGSLTIYNCNVSMNTNRTSLTLKVILVG